MIAIVTAAAMADVCHDTLLQGTKVCNEKFMMLREEKMCYAKK
ncbi:MAG: hypothetical protein ACJ70U_06405 [Nitrososphaera sp.]